MAITEATGGAGNCGTFVGGTAPSFVFAKPTIASRNFALFATPNTRVISPAGTTNVFLGDTNSTAQSGASTITDYAITVQYLRPGFTESIAVTSLDEAILASPVNDVAAGVTLGWATLKATASSGEFALQRVYVTSVLPNSSYSFISYRSNSLAKHITDAIDGRIYGKTNSSTAIFSVRNNSTNTYVRNTDCWAADIDLTSMAVATVNDPGGQASPGILISPRHILFAAHYPPSVNAQFRFVTQDNTVVTRTLTAKLTHPAYSPYYPDLSVGVLDSDVPNTIGFAKILPQNYRNYLPTLNGSSGTVPSNTPLLPVFGASPEKAALVRNLYTINDQPASTKLVSFSVPENASSRYPFYVRNYIVGDSGSPMCLIINNELVVLTVLTGGGAGNGTSVHSFKSDINTMMTTLGGGYQLTEVSLSGFPTY